jgi:hypothetical protein
MKYLVRSIKYFIYFSLMCTVIVSVLVMIGAVEGDINSIFEDGYASIGKIAIFFALVAAVYPKVGFINRGISSDKEWSEVRNDVIEYMKERQWELESESDGAATFRVKGVAARLSKMYEDRITLTRSAEGYQMEGLRKDVMRLATGLEHRLDPQS